ncbi:unnamed protein product [Amoebophrya sp. A25]|nr:unnamed protein product [Amoebophrya sp. A25]|eukprot:GSA25T00004727001.1
MIIKKTNPRLSVTAIKIDTLSSHFCLKAKYRELVRIHHPDKKGETAEFQRIDASFRELDRLYDNDGNFKYNKYKKDSKNKARSSTNYGAAGGDVDKNKDKNGATGTGTTGGASKDAASKDKDNKKDKATTSAGAGTQKKAAEPGPARSSAAAQEPSSPSTSPSKDGTSKTAQGDRRGPPSKTSSPDARSSPPPPDFDPFATPADFDPFASSSGNPTSPSRPADASRSPSSTKTTTQRPRPRPPDVTQRNYDEESSTSSSSSSSSGSVSPPHNKPRSSNPSGPPPSRHTAGTAPYGRSRASAPAAPQGVDPFDFGDPFADSHDFFANTANAARNFSSNSVSSSSFPTSSTSPPESPVPHSAASPGSYHETLRVVEVIVMGFRNIERSGTFKVEVALDGRSQQMVDWTDVPGSRQTTYCSTIEAFTFFRWREDSYVQIILHGQRMFRMNKREGEAHLSVSDILRNHQGNFENWVALEHKNRRIGEVRLRINMDGPELQLRQPPSRPSVDPLHQRPTSTEVPGPPSTAARGGVSPAGSSPILLQAARGGGPPDIPVHGRASAPPEMMIRSGRATPSGVVASPPVTFLHPHPGVGQASSSMQVAVPGAPGSPFLPPARRSEQSRSLSPPRTYGSNPFDLPGYGT